MKIGLVINPIAGVGAALAWKGTDDVDAAWDAIEQGEKQPIWGIVRRALDSIPNNLSINWILGDEYPLDLAGKVVHSYSEHSTAEDTKNAVKKIIQHKIDLIIFAGGDGTAVDVAQETQNIPILGIPGGVKIFSPCFLHRPEDLGVFLRNWNGDTTQVDLLDLDEQEYRQGRAKPKLVGNTLIPNSQNIQQGKSSWSSDDSSTFRLIAERIEEEGWLENKVVLIGPGSTMKNIFGQLGLNITLLGVDLIEDKKIIKLDTSENDLLDIKVDQIWVSPIGNQGHIFGRGNRQIPTALIRSVGKKQIKIFSSVEKIRNTPKLYIDTGDPELDNLLKGYYSVVVGYHEEIMKKVI